jgi:hypothetical protein
MPERRGRASPSLDFAAKMLDPVNLDGLQRFNGGTDRVGADICLRPEPTLLKMYHPRGLYRSSVPCCLYNKTGRISEYDQGSRVSEEVSGLL